MNASIVLRESNTSLSSHELMSPQIKNKDNFLFYLDAVTYKSTNPLRPLLLTWLNFNPNMDK